MKKQTQILGNKLVMALASVVLLFASATKYIMVMTEPVLSQTFWESREFFIIQMFLTTGLAIWLVCGLFRKAGWILAILAFSVFIIDVLYKGIIGEPSCGCFGRVEVNPWTTLFAINLPMLILLLIFRPVGEKLFPPPWPNPKHFFGVAIPTFILLAALVGSAVLYEPPTETDAYRVVDHQSWVGEDFEMLEQIDIAQQLRDGMAVIMFYREDCSVCHEMMPVYDQISTEAHLGGMDATFAFIEMPPHGDEPIENYISPDSTVITGKLDDTIKWYTATPLLVIIDNGIVLRSFDSELPQDLGELFSAIFE